MGGQAQRGGGSRRQERKGNQTGRRLIARGDWSCGRDLSTPVLMTTHWEWEKGLRGLLGPKTLGPGPHVDNGLRGPREWQKVPRGRMGLDLLIPVHCPLVTECHFPPLPSGCQDNWANIIPAWSPKPSPHPTKPSDASRQGKMGLGRRK